MSKIKYIYNTETCTYEPVRTTPKKFLINLSAFLGAALLIAFGLIYTYERNFTSIKELKLSEENEMLHTKWNWANEQLIKANQSLTNLQIKDDSIYRTILDITPLPPATREAGIGGSDRYAYLVEENLVENELIISTYRFLDKIKKKSFIQSLSYDELFEVEKEKEIMWAARPAIQPIHDEELTRLHTTYGMRFHPKLNIWRPHKGLDFTAPRGTPVYATGDGVVKRAGLSSSYGRVIYLDHGYDYKTRYAHLSKMNVTLGQEVKRGDIIGYVGSTGISEAPHLHYEVLYKNDQINPIDFFHRDLSVEEYEKLIANTNDDAPALDAH